MKKIIFACIMASLLLTGCKQDSPDHSTNNSKQSNSVSSTIVTSETTSVTTSETSDTISQTTAEEPVNTAPSSTSDSSQEQVTDTVSQNEFGGYATFYFTGMNVPDSININTNSNQLTFDGGTSQATVYAFSMQNVPVKTIRVFSANNHDMRTVQVSTQLVIGSQISGPTISNHQTDELYLFHNKQGGLSLATPNYAGNVPEDQQDVMIEVLQ